MSAPMAMNRLDERQKTLLLTLLQSGVNRSDLVDLLQSGSDQEWDDELRSFDLLRKILKIPILKNRVPILKNATTDS